MRVPSNEGKLSLAELARFRQGAYRLFGALFLYPETERMELAIDAARVIESQRSQLAELGIFVGCELPLSALERERETGLVRLQEAFLRLFGAGAAGPTCSPYESVYLKDQRRSAIQITVQLEQEYATGGLQMSPSLREMPDHAAVELEFLSYLCGREAQSWEARQQPAAIKSLCSEVAFLQKHLVRWFPKFTSLVAMKDDRGTYGAIAEATLNYVLQDVDLLAALLSGLPEVADSV